MAGKRDDRTMVSTDISVIIPMRNLEQEIAGIVRSVAGQIADLQVEYIIVDMGSTDHGVLEALSVIKESKLRGYVVQNGNGTTGAAFNTGIYKAAGEYITFLFPRRLYRDFISGYYQDARKTDADIVFGVPTGERFFCGTGPAKICEGSEVAQNLLHSSYGIDIGAVLLRRNFLLENRILFTEGCAYGYAEEFILRALLYTSRAVESPTLVIRDKIYQVRGSNTKTIGVQCFERIEALKRVYSVIQARHGKNHKLAACFLQEKMPDAVLSCIDSLLDEGTGYNAIRSMLRLKGYEKFLIAGKHSGHRLRKAIVTWKMIPWMYKSRNKG